MAEREALRRLRNMKTLGSAIAAPAILPLALWLVQAHYQMISMDSASWAYPILLFFIWPLVSLGVYYCVIDDAERKYAEAFGQPWMCDCGTAGKLFAQCTNCGGLDPISGSERKSLGTILKAFLLLGVSFVIGLAFLLGFVGLFADRSNMKQINDVLQIAYYLGWLGFICCTLWVALYFWDRLVEPEPKRVPDGWVD